MVTILFETKEAAQFFSDTLLGDWDSCNGVDLEYLDSAAIDLAVNNEKLVLLFKTFNY